MLRDVAVEGFSLFKALNLFAIQTLPVNENCCLTIGLVPILKYQLVALLAVAHNFLGQFCNLLILDILEVAKLHEIQHFQF